MLVCLLVPVSVAHLRHHSRELDCRWLRVERSPEASKGVWFSQRARLRLCDSHNFPTTLGDRRAPVLPGILQALLIDQQRWHARHEERNEDCRFAHLSRLRSIAASKRCSFAARVQLFDLATRAVTYAKELRARRKQYRGTSRGHTLSVRSYSARPTRRASRSRRAATSPK